MPDPKTLFDKVWDAHVVRNETVDTPGVLYIDLHLVHEVTSPQAFSEIEARGLKVRRPDRTYATLDHSTPTLPAGLNGLKPYVTAQAEAQVHRLEKNCAAHGVPLAGWGSEDRGVVHVMGPELGLTQPGMTVVCGDSHTATHGAFGALAFGIGTSEVGHVLATQCLLQRKAKAMRVTVTGQLQPGVSGKDVALAVIAAIGFGGGTGYVIEYAGEAVRSLDMEGRMTLCNMSIEAGARAGMIAPDQTTIDWLRGRKHVPADYPAATAEWLKLATDPGASFDKEVVIDGAAIRPMATWGTTPDAGAPIGTPVPQPAGGRGLHRLVHQRPSARSARRRRGAARPQGQAGPAHAGGSRFGGRASRRRGRRPARGLHRRRRRMAYPRLFDVYRHERGFRRARPVGGLDLEPQFRRPPGQGCPHHPGQSGDGGGDGGGRGADRSARLSAGGDCPQAVERRARDGRSAKCLSPFRS
jgi:homoaconitase/3-isopropylmalate dehydratase large subunit